MTDFIVVVVVVVHCTIRDLLTTGINVSLLFAPYGKNYKIYCVFILHDFLIENFNARNS